MKIAVVGSGISGLSCAYRLARSGYDVSLFEANDYFGGHVHTVDVTLDGTTQGIDTGFLVFNHRRSPHLVALFDELNVPTVATELSLSVKTTIAGKTLAWASGNLDRMFAQRRNLYHPGFLRMLKDVWRFNRQATALLRTSHTVHQETLWAYLSRCGYSKEFIDWYLLPITSCLWHCTVEQMFALPLHRFVRICDNYGFLTRSDRPDWHTVEGNARQYVDKMLEAIPIKYLNTPVTTIYRSTLRSMGMIRIETAKGSHLFDHVVLATHSDQSLRILHDPTAEEYDVLSSIRYQSSRAVLHTDPSCLPDSHKMSSVFHVESHMENGNPRSCVHYLPNSLQPTSFKQAIIVSLDPIDNPSSEHVIGAYSYAYPVLDGKTVAAQQKLPALQGNQNTWFAGAWTGDGFHEDALKSGLSVARALLSINSNPALNRAEA